jgi:mono/diheme cytochrome c family protein
LNKRSLFSCSLVLIACGGSAPPAEAPASGSASPDAAPAGAAPADGAAPTATPEAAASGSATAGAFAQQAKAGQSLYTEYCSSCHGAHGNDGKSPPVVGLAAGALPLAPPPKAKLRTTQFKTVGDVAEFVKKTMPPKAPGSLSSDDYYAILAFDLQANGIDLGDKKLDETVAAGLEIPRK